MKPLSVDISAWRLQCLRSAQAKACALQHGGTKPALCSLAQQAAQLRLATLEA